jgi:hypothetical protein
MPPGVWLNYDCLSKIINLGVEWLGNVGDYRLTRMKIDWNELNSEKLIWELERKEIEAVQKKLTLNWNDLAGFKKNLGMYDLFIKLW